jgi:hypothetical protein
MATVIGSFSIGPGPGAVNFYEFGKPQSEGFLPLIYVIPTSPSFTNPQGLISGSGAPYFNQLGVSPLWSQLSDDETELTYYIAVQNESNNAIEFSFVEMDF